MWDRGHAFVGANGAGSCLHVDQALGEAVELVVDVVETMEIWGWVKLPMKFSYLWENHGKTMGKPMEMPIKYP